MQQSVIDASEPGDFFIQNQSAQGYLVLFTAVIIGAAKFGAELREIGIACIRLHLHQAVAG
ncbi:hypothetical protein D3C85_1755100 [compost metagenome]